MNILVTGANGFIGQALCKRLLGDGYHVRGAKSRDQRSEVREQRSESEEQKLRRLEDKKVIPVE